MTDLLATLLDAMPERKRADKIKDITLLKDLFDGVKRDTFHCTTCKISLDDLRYTKTIQERIRDCLIENWTIRGALNNEFLAYYVPYDVGNKKKHTVRALTIKYADNDTMDAIRQTIKEMYGIDPKNYIMATVIKNKVVRLHP